MRCRSPRCACTLRRTPLPHSIDASLHLITPSPFRTVASPHLRETPDRPGLEVFLRVGDRTLDSRCHEHSWALSFHGLLVPLQGSSSVVARPQPSLRGRVSLHTHRSLCLVGSTLDPALRWTGSVQQAAQGSRGASVRQVPLRWFLLPKQEEGHRVAFMGFSTSKNGLDRPPRRRC